MARFALMNGNVVANVVEADNANVLPGVTLLPAPDGTLIGDIWNGSTFSRPPRWFSLALAKYDLRLEVARRRIALERSGVTVGAYEVPTDPEFMLRMRALKDWSDSNPTEDIELERPDGEWVLVTRAQFLAAAQAIAAHYRACAAAMRAHVDAIGALTTVAEAEAYDVSTGWPA